MAGLCLARADPRRIALAASLVSSSPADLRSSSRRDTADLQSAGIARLCGVGGLRLLCGCLMDLGQHHEAQA